MSAPERRMRTSIEDADVTRLLREYDAAIADEQDAASRAASAADELRDLGIDLDKLRPNGAGA